MYISHSVMDGRRHSNPLNPRCFCFCRWSQWGGSRSSGRSKSVNSLNFSDQLRHVPGKYHAPWLWVARALPWSVCHRCSRCRHAAGGARRPVTTAECPGRRRAAATSETRPEQCETSAGLGRRPAPRRCTTSSASSQPSGPIRSHSYSVHYRLYIIRTAWDVIFGFRYSSCMATPWCVVCKRDESTAKKSNHTLWEN